MAFNSDCLDPITGEIVDFSAAMYYMLLEMKDTLDEINSKISSVASVQAGSILVSEYYNNQDGDNDGLIYGIDFYITTGRPKILDSIPFHGFQMTWDQYKESHAELFN